MFPNTRADHGEQQPLVKSVSRDSMGGACFLAVVGALVCAWCVLDGWQHSMSSNLFGVSQVSNTHVNMLTGQITADVQHPFTYPLTLAFMQFTFMAVIFLTIWLLVSRDRMADVAGVRRNIFGAQWGGLVTTHIFGTFWLQSLMMPMQMMTPAMFAASRALQVPAAAGFRSKIIGARYGGHPLSTTAMMAGAAMLLIYSQAMISECLCIWSGHGIQLAGVALAVIYFFLLILPAANAVCMESVMIDLETNPVLMLATMNIIACLCCVPILGFAHMTGWEDVQMALTVTAAHRPLYMMVLWLGVQMVIFSAVTLALIAATDSFWTMALTVCFKAVFWWCGNLIHMYMSCPLSDVSVQNPHASLWGFIMLLGCVTVGVAATIDASTPKELISNHKSKHEHV